MTFHGQHPLQYVPQHVNNTQPAFGSGPFNSNNGANAPPGFGEMSLTSEHGAFLPNDFASSAAPNFDQPQAAGYLRAFSGQMCQLECRFDGRLQETRLRAESAERSVWLCREPISLPLILYSALSKLEAANSQQSAHNRALEARLEKLETQVNRLQESLENTRVSARALHERLDSLDDSVGERFEDDYETVRILAGVIMRVARQAIDESEVKILEKYSHQGELQ